MVTITNRNLTKKFTAFYEKLGLYVSVITVGSGTAASEILDYFGLDGSEKSVIFQIVTGEKWKEVKRQLRAQMKIDIPGIGISFIIPLSTEKSIYSDTGYWSHTAREKCSRLPGAPMGAIQGSSS